MKELQQQPRYQGSDRMALVRHINPESFRPTGLLDWNTGLDDSDILDRVQEMTDMIYSWIATRETKHPPNPLRIQSLPEVASSQNLIAATTHTRFILDADGPPDHAVDLVHATPIMQKEQDELIDGTNALLRALNLAELTGDEARSLNRDNTPIPPLSTRLSHPHNESSTGVKDIWAGPPSRPAQSKSQGSNSRLRKHSGLFSSAIAFGGGFGQATSILSVLDASLAAFTIIRSIQNAEKELVMLGKRMGHYLALIPEAANVLSRSTSKTMVDLGNEVLKDMGELLRTVNSILGDRVGDKAKLLTKLKWYYHKRAFKEATEFMESLKATITIMTQVHLIEVQEKNMAKTELYFRHLKEEHGRLERFSTVPGIQNAHEGRERNSDVERKGKELIRV